MNKDEIAGLIRDLRTHAYDDCGERDIPTHIGNQAADALTTLSARVETLEAALIAEHESNLWNAYNTGHAHGGRWTHMFMSDGEWLARECGFDCNLADFDDAAIRAAIPVAARKAIGGDNG